MKKKNYIITLDGCDDYTAFQMQLTQSQFELIYKLEELSRAKSWYSCMPRLSIVEGVLPSE